LRQKNQLAKPGEFGVRTIWIRGSIRFGQYFARLNRVGYIDLQNLIGVLRQFALGHPLRHKATQQGARQNTECHPNQGGGKGDKNALLEGALHSVKTPSYFNRYLTRKISLKYRHNLIIGKTEDSLQTIFVTI
jgi:hypothetical protein